MAMTELPLTLVLVSYNKADVIGLALASAARGSARPDLVVISDDGSDDGTPDVAERAAREAGLRCEVIRHPRAGVYRIQAMRNTCVAHALEGVVYLSDSDCLFGAHALATHVEIHRRHPLAIGTGPRFEFLAGTSGPFTSTATTLEYAHFPYGTHFVPVGANISFRKQLWRELGGFDRAFDGSYGMEEFEFSARARRAGAVCISDPGAFVFHVPHETVFGARAPDRNRALFDAKYGTDLLAEERLFLSSRVTPWYWRGRRKRPLLGDLVERDLNAWGAPDGFVPPLHLQLSRTLAPLIGAVETALATSGDAGLAPLAKLVFGIDNTRLGAASPALVFCGELQWVLEHHQGRDAVDPHLRRWLDGARVVDRELAGTAPRVEAMPSEGVAYATGTAAISVLAQETP